MKNIGVYTPAFTLMMAENQIVGVASRSDQKLKNKPITRLDSGRRDWQVLPLLIPTPTI